MITDDQVHRMVQLGQNEFITTYLALRQIHDKHENRNIGILLPTLRERALLWGQVLGAPVHPDWQEN